MVWQQLGFGVVVFTAALLALPPETAEAARIDGAGWWSLQLRVLVPQIRPIIELLTVIQVITVLSWVFNYVYVLTSGGPGYASSVMELYIWRSFSNGANGTAASVAVMLLGHGERPDRALAVGAAAGGGDMRSALPAGVSSGWSRGTRSSSIICLAALYPLWFIVSTALKTNAAYQLDPTGFPTHPTLGALRSIVADQPLPALDVEQLPRHRLVGRRVDADARCSPPTRSCSAASAATGSSSRRASR